jgi:hypothetical protein
VARSEEVATSRFAEYNGNASEELASLIREGIQAFCEFFKNSQFDKMAQFYSPDTTVMLPHRPTIRGASSLPAMGTSLIPRKFESTLHFTTAVAGASTGNARITYEKPTRHRLTVGVLMLDIVTDGR